MRPPRDFTMEQHLIQQNLARIGHVSSPDHQSSEPDPNPYRSGLKPATAERLLLKVLDQSKEQYAAQQQQQVPTTNIPSNPAFQTRKLEPCNEPSFLPLDTSFTTPSSPGTETRHEPRHEHESPPSSPPPRAPLLRPTRSPSNGLPSRRKTRLEIKRQL